LAADFSTGGNAGGYLINSIQLAMTNASGNPNGFTVMIYSAIVSAGGINPGTNLETLNGSLNPTTAGIFTYTPAPSLTLSQNTKYYIVLTAGTAINNGAYEWSIEDASRPSSDGWLGYGVLQSSDGQNGWSFLGAPQFPYSQFAINATAIPEPGVLGLFALGGLAFLWHRRKAKAV
jgi:hypothetical protein